MIQNLHLKRGCGRTRPSREATTSRLRDELDGDTEAPTYYTRKSEKKHWTYSQSKDEVNSLSVKGCSNRESNGSSKSRPSMRSE